MEIYKEKVNGFKKNIISKIEQNLDDYQIYKIKNGKEFDYILVKRNSIHDNVLKTAVKVNEPIHL